MLFSAPLGLIGWRFYGWWMALAMAGVGVVLPATALRASR